MTARMTLPQARRTALAAQGLGRERPTGPATARQVGRIVDRLELLQIDSVNVLSRAHYLPVFSRAGSYDKDVLDRMSGRGPRRLVEYWAHEASFVRPRHFADLRVWQRRRWVGELASSRPAADAFEGRIVELLESSRPLTAREVTARLGHVEEVDRSNWGWNWSAVKGSLERLFERGEIGSAGRNAQFERRYAPTAKVLPPGLDATAAPDPHEAMLRLVEAAARAHGIGTVRCFADYFRLPRIPAAAAVERLVERGVLEPVEVAGWTGSHYLHTEATRPRRAAGRALLSPFDSLVFERRRLEELFGCHYRIEIYTPAQKRRYGYYVLPFLLREGIAGRVDLKADRATGTLQVRSAHAEQGAPADTAAELAAELRLMASWLGLGDVVVHEAGDLAPALAVELAAAP
ncbi:winged helix-turn-helix domain-containing protein [Zafaria sp. J156]|uniref:winged helix-turn-helix domain-containing protein n=1 Tax=Zafaria sp. J156 TaxID=3116490 RepID=UPI002E790CC2|nr:crosslink repair DNA glycosylase YcaQ family protein [Zafaria sp. J156]MEE1620311.1 crosslink repair DNA glycosylase YcaQ family protein [Zafaria sp. J156]